MKINLADYVGQNVVATQRDGSVLAGMLTDDGPSPFVYKLQGRIFLDNGSGGGWNCSFDQDIIDISVINPFQNTMKDLLTLLTELTNSRVMKPPFHIRKKENGDFALSIVRDKGNDLGTRYEVTDSVVFTENGEVTAKGTTTLHDLLRESKRAKALAKLTAEDREVLGL